MGRGMARHRQMGGGEKYTLAGVQKLSRVSALVDMKYYRRELGTREGTIISRVAGRVHVVWDDEPGKVEQLSEKDCRFWVDTNRWRIRPPSAKSIFSFNMRSTAEVAGSLTADQPPCNDEASKGATPTDMKGDTSVAEITTAEFAEKLGTDTKTLRKFLRKQLSKEAQPGQGGRYTFDASEVKRLTKAWEKWSDGKVDKDEPKGAKDAKPPAKSKKAKGKKVEEELEVLEEDDEDEPSAEDLEDIDLEDVEDIEDLLGDDDEDEDE